MTTLTQLSQTILKTYQIRKGKKRKEEFRAWLCAELTKLGYDPKIETKGISSNVVVGDPEKAKVLYTAHYDTCAVLPFPNFITPRNFFWYLVYQFLIIVPLFALAIGAEVGTILLWEAIFGGECPILVALLPMYIVLLGFMWMLMAGPSNKHTVNDNTSGVLTLVEIAQALPEQLRQEVCLVFFDNEELGLFGSSAFAKAHKSIKKTALVVNFDCVSDGDYIQFFPSAALKKETGLLTSFEAVWPSAAEKTTEVVRSFGFYPSDQAQFKRGVGVCALKKSRIFGFYMDRIHTKKDTVLMAENIHLLRRGSVELAEMLAGKK